jgi:hypothetical protein
MLLPYLPAAKIQPRICENPMNFRAGRLCAPAHQNPGAVLPQHPGFLTAFGMTPNS